MAIGIGIHGAWASTAALLGGVAWQMRRQTQQQAAERWRERRLREELESYARLDPSLTHSMHSGNDSMEAARQLARRVCRTVAEKSRYTRVAMLLRNPEGRFACVGSVGTDDLTVAALHAWGEKLVTDERAGRMPAGSLPATIPSDARSFAIHLGEWNHFDREVGTWALAGRKERRRWRRALVAPIRTRTGHGLSRLAGAIVVCCDGDRGDLRGPDSMGAIETLAERLATAMENEALSERLLRSEKLAGLGQLAGGVAHALNNPLTAVLGFAELIAETSSEPRVRQDAATILAEAVKMRHTVQRLVEFWRPPAAPDEPVEVTALLEKLAGDCSERLREREVRLEFTASPGAPSVRGCRERLREVFEHLLNNAAQAIAKARPREPGEEHAIRITVSHDERTLHIIVSDTGPGFSEPGRIFDPFYTTKGPEQGAGLGLSICYGIVREHGGEISAFNLHPHGAAVVVELPAGRVVDEAPLLLRDRTESKA